MANGIIDGSKNFLISFTSEQAEMQRSVRDFAQKKVLPHVMEWDEAQHFPMDVFHELGEMGCCGIMVPEEYGGSGLGYVEYAIIIEELAKVDPSLALTIAAHNGLCTNHILQFGNDTQKKKYLPDLAAGKIVGAWGLTESVSGSDSGSLQTFAEKCEGGYIVNGSKTFTTHGTVGKTVVIMAKTDKTKHTKGISAFVVDPETKGFIRGKKENKLGMRSSDTTQLSFENMFVPDENLLGNENEGFKQAMKILEGGRISIAALSIGLAQGALDAALKYSGERRQFGKALNEFQGTQMKLANMATNIEAARLMTFRSAVMKDRGESAIRYAAKAKLFASEIAERAASEAVQIFGGYGFIKDFPVEKFYRDVKLLTIGEGTSEVQRIVIARQLLND